MLITLLRYLTPYLKMISKYIQLKMNKQILER